MVRQQTEPDLDSGAEQERRMRQAARKRKLSALVLVAAHVAGSTAEAQEELGIQVAVQVKDYLAEGVIRNAVNLPALSPDQYKRVQPYLTLAQKLGSLVSQAAATRPARG